MRKPVETGTEMTEQELIAANVRNAKQALRVMEDLDKIKIPLESTIYMAGNRSTYRNHEYRKMLSEMDIKTKEELQKFIKDKNVKVMDKIFKRNGK